MQNGAWVGESSSSANPRDSRVVSIYEKYLYDPKDLESTDPRRRELARKASQLKLQGQPANNMEANGLRSQPAPPQQRKSIAFSQGTKPVDGRTAAAGMRAQNTTTTSRDSGAFGLGLGMLGGADSDSDSDSDNEPARAKVASPGLDRLKKAASPQRPDSWSDRAAAVGQRPPDNASQNPPSLKLMALKSAKQGGDVPMPQPNQQRLAARAEPVDRTSRHGSTIGFAGPPNDKHISARIALTKQLGLITPSPTREESNAPQDYFDRQAPRNNSSGPTPPRQAAVPPPIDVRRAQNQQPSFGQTSRQTSNDRPFPSPMGSARSYGSSPNSATPLRSAGPSPNGAMMPPNVLQRGPPSPYSPNGQPGPSPPHPAALRAGNGAVPPRGGMPPPPGGRGPQAPMTRGPPAQTGQGPSFSDARGQQKRQSLFRRSMAYLGGQPGPAGQSNGGPGARSGPQTRPGQAGQRRSLFRRSMALLGTNGGQQQGRAMAPPPPVSPLPRVQGLQEDYEKPDHPRKSQFLGGGGSGAEWDLQGEGAKFWRRFSVAQKTAHMPKVEDGSKAWLASTKKGKRKLAVLATLTLIILVGVIVGAIVWREIVSPSGKVSSLPESSYHANLGAKENPSGATSISTSRNAASTSSATSSNTRRSVSKRSPASPAQQIMDTVHLHSKMLTDSNTTGKRTHRLRKRHFGQPAPLSPHAAE